MALPLGGAGILVALVVLVWLASGFYIVDEGRRGVVTRSVVVAYGDLDLAAAQGVETLYVRLRGAARRVCAPRDTRIAEPGRDWSQCVDNALDDAVAATGIGKVLAMHSEATGRDVSRASQLAGAP